MITIVLPTQQKMMMQEAIIQKLLLYFESIFSTLSFSFSYETNVK